MRRTLAVTLASFAVLAAPPTAGAQVQELRAVVGPGFTITLTDANGVRVSHLPAGTYTIRVDDRSEFHNFHLVGPGVNRATEVESRGEETWQVTLTDGVYTYVCDPHSSEMVGRFAVGSATLPSAPPRPTRLVATVGPGSTISFRSASGGRVTSLAAGAYVITVRDRSRALNFRLTGPGVRRATGLRFRGTTTWRVTLRAGTYRFASDAGARRLRGTFHVH